VTVPQCGDSDDGWGEVCVSKDVYKWEASAYKLQPGDVLSFVGLCMWVECLIVYFIAS